MPLGNLDNWDPALVDDIAIGRDVMLFDASGVGLLVGRCPPHSGSSVATRWPSSTHWAFAEVDLFGFSIGGFVAQEIALQRPHLVHR